VPEVQARLEQQPQRSVLRWEDLPEITPAAVNLGNIPTRDEVERWAGSDVKWQYRVVTPDDLLQAANRSTIADLLELETNVAWLSGQADPRQYDASQVTVEVLRLRAEDVRQQAAAQLSLTFWNLAEAEQVRLLLHESRSVLEQARSDLRRLREAGLVAAAEERTLTQQSMEVDEQLLELELTISQLNRALASALGVTLPSDGRFWPQANWNVEDGIPERQECIQHALSARTELRLLRLLLDQLDSDTVAAVRHALNSQYAALGIAPRLDRLLRRLIECSYFEAEQLVRREQLERLYNQQQADVEAEVAQKHLQLVLALRHVAQAGEQRDLARRVRDDQSAGRRSGQVTIATDVRSELELRRAEVNLVRRMAALHRARTELALACGRVWPEENTSALSINTITVTTATFEPSMHHDSLVSVPVVEDHSRDRQFAPSTRHDDLVSVGR